MRITESKISMNLNIITKDSIKERKKQKKKKKNLIIHMREERAKVIDEGREREANWGR